MKIGSAASIPTHVHPQTGAKLVEAQRTPVSRTELRGAIERAYQKLTGNAPTRAFLDTLTAHASLETGSGAQMYNYNFGGIKGRSPTGETAVCRTKEVYSGNEVEVRDGFRAYRSLDDGAVDYLRLMQGRFGGAISNAESGDLAGFAHALKKAGYYTADESKYARALESLAGSRVERVATVSAPSPLAGVTSSSLPSDASYPHTVELGRVLDAIARHPVTVDEGEDEDDR
jgi:hypothetical protein